METSLKEIIGAVLDVNTSEIYDNFCPDDTPMWDSMNNLRLITAIEDHFDIKLSMDDIQTMTDFSIIKNIVTRYVNNHN